MAKIKQSKKQKEALLKVDASLEQLRGVMDLMQKDGEIQISAGKGRGIAKVALGEGEKAREEVMKVLERYRQKLVKEARALAKDCDLEFSEEEEALLDNKALVPAVPERAEADTSVEPTVEDGEESRESMQKEPDAEPAPQYQMPPPGASSFMGNLPGEETADAIPGHNYSGYNHI